MSFSSSSSSSLCTSSFSFLELHCSSENILFRLYCYHFWSNKDCQNRKHHPGFNTVMHNCQCIFTKLWLACFNTIVEELSVVCVTDACVCVSVFDFSVSRYSFSVHFIHSMGCFA